MNAGTNVSSSTNTGQSEWSEPATKSEGAPTKAAKQAAALASAGPPG
jgi:hypothetical protein